MARVVVVSRDGRTVVLTGWKAWLAGAAAFAIVWVVLALAVFVVVGVGLTLGVLALLAIPALVGVALVGSALGRRR